ncbi:MAG: DMT family transporter [Anaerolineae bacterium]|nr:DMT family transporter [Anaerolineae bacterium]MDW8070087.1 DMT family transporter [Anaerolineae bacterium]
MQPSARRGLWLAVIAVCFFSTSPVLMLWADPLSPYEKTFWRMMVGALSVLGIALMQGSLPRYNYADPVRFLGFGLVTAVHFLGYIAALNFTSIAHALTITYTSPIFVTLFSALYLKEPVAPRKYLGILVVLAGIAVLVGFQPALDGTMLIGDGLALLSAITFGIYSVMGRSQRTTYPLLTYAFATYGMASMWMLPGALLTWTSSGYGLRQMLALFLSGVVPLGIGHTLYNAAIRHTHATYVNLIATQEVTGGMLLGMLILGQAPSLNALIGAAITLIGVAIVLL